LENGRPIPTAIRDTLDRSHSAHAPWTVIRSDDKRRARLAVIRRSCAMDYPDKDAGVRGPPPTPRSAAAPRSGPITPTPVEPERMVKRGYHHGNLKQALVDAALQLIEDKGPRASPCPRPPRPQASRLPPSIAISKGASS
jgi:hypothetical protein